MNNKIQELKKRMEKLKEDFPKIMWSWQEEQLVYLLSEYDRLQEENEKMRKTLGELKFEMKSHRSSIFHESLNQLGTHADFMLHKINSVLEDDDKE